MSLRSSERGLKWAYKHHREKVLMSLRSSERGLKYIIFGSNFGRCIVAPFVGAWIEMYKSLPIDLTDFVAPFVGAWIEMQLKRVMLI